MDKQEPLGRADDESAIEEGDRVRVVGVGSGEVAAIDRRPYANTPEREAVTLLVAVPGRTTLLLVPDYMAVKEEVYLRYGKGRRPDP